MRALPWLGLVVGLAACTHPWDDLDPRLSGSGAQTSVTTSGAGTGGGSSSTTGGDGGAGAQGGGAEGGGGAGQGGSGGAGGGGPLRCGGTSLLADDFDDGAIGDLWWDSDSGGAVIDEAGGEIVILLPDLSSSWSAFQSKRLYDLHGDHFSVEVTAVVNDATSARQFIAAVAGGGDYLVIWLEEGTLHFTREVGGQYLELASVAFDPAVHRYWRLREDAGTTFWETSGDGNDYTVRAEASNDSLFPLDLLRFEVGASTDGSEVGPGEARFDDVNGGRAGGVWCKLSSFTDDFDDGDVSRRWDRSFFSATCTAAEIGGEAVMTLGSDSTDYCAYMSATSFDATGEGAIVEVTELPDPGVTAEAYFRLEVMDVHGVQITADQGDLSFGVIEDGTYQTIASLLYDPVDHRWWRLREAGGTAFFETSPDGAAWTTRADAPTPAPLTAVDVILGGGTWLPVVAPGEARYDNFNLPP